ncbi:hypothetical protein RHGRI_018168 [Rhododendron griersonianum]|uniref:Uncharacterized protein n=1 Tax=Rhododendron griersonianum TaxID=479676 RepID=A0AAV6K0M4_9ERIC|nr:hypothetical protein RHGRI_018168 [Rhododendron griersonianum]
MPMRSYEESPRFLRGASIELSLENGINGPETGGDQETPGASKFPASWQLGEEDSFTDASLELLPMPISEDNLSTKPLPVIGINAGSLEGATTLDGANFKEDICFTGGDTLRTETKIGDGEGLVVYQTARFGNFSYRLKTLERGNYIVDLHLAEIVFTDGPPGMRVFDVYIQEQKVVSCIDIYARVGANKPLVIPNLKAFVNGFGEVELIKATEMSQITETEPPKDIGEYEVEQIEKLQVEYECQKRELTETRKALEKLKRENETFAIEGQVKEKSRWFSSMRDLKRKLKLLKMDQIKLSEEALSYKKCLVDMNDMSSIIQSKVNEQVELHNDIKNKFVKGAKERKELYNKILELKGNIRVFCRCRPLNTDEIAAGASMAMDFEAAKDVYGAHLLPDRRILLHSVCSIVSYDVQADSFSFFENYFGGVACNAAVPLDGVLFFYREERGVFGYDVVNRKWFPSPVMGLRNGTVLPYDDKYPTFLRHLGGGRLCIVWSSRVTKDGKKLLIIRSIVFRVSKKTPPDGGQPLFQASIDSFKKYYLEGDLPFECLAL